MSCSGVESVSAFIAGLVGAAQLMETVGSGADADADAESDLVVIGSSPCPHLFYPPVLLFSATSSPSRRVFGRYSNRSSYSWPMLLLLALGRRSVTSSREDADSSHSKSPANRMSDKFLVHLCICGVADWE